MKHFLTVAEHSTEELRHVMDVAKRLKAQLKTTGRNDQILAGQVMALIFEKPSLRTRVSFATAIAHLGGFGLLLRGEEVGIDTREPVQDVARVLSGMCDGIMMRTFAHDKVERLARHASVPVINGLTDLSHPCQAMADLMTIEEHFGNLKGRTLTFVGDGNNVARSLAVACGRFGMRFVLAAPPGYELSGEDEDKIMFHVPDLDFVTTRDPADAVRDADVVYTDTWVSMGQEDEKAKRLKDFHGYIVDEKLMAEAPRHAIVLHCLPAYRGYEISEGVLEGSQSKVFPQAENRLHLQKGLIAVLMGGQ
jgi:ornithine carbamoyltransferase